MFIKVPIFKKLLKQAFAADRMKVRMDGSGLTVDCGHFAVWFERENIPNKIKSAIVELAGEIPEEGQEKREITFARYLFRILSVKERRIEKVEIEILPPPEENEEGEKEKDEQQ